MKFPVYRPNFHFNNAFLRTRSGSLSLRRNAAKPLALLIGSLLCGGIIVGCNTSSEDTEPPVPGANAPKAKNVSKDPWRLATDSPFENHGGYLGNGFIGMRFGASGTTNSPDGRAPAHMPMNKGRDLQCLVTGLYLGEHLIPAPDWGAFLLESDGVKAQPEADNVANYRQTLNMRRGELVTSYAFPAKRPLFTLELTSRVHRDHPNLVTYSARITPLRDGEVTVHALLPVPEPEYYDVVSRTDNGLVVKVKESIPPANQYLSILQRIDALDSAGNVVSGREVKPGVQSFSLKAKEPLFLTKWVHVNASPQPIPNALPAAEDALNRLMGAGHNALVASHREAWEKLWQSDIEIEGDLEAQQVVRSSLFYLLCSVREGAKWSIPPMGLSGIQWGGHIFWDADTWMWPVLALLHPELAETMVDYRFVTLEGAKWNAKQNGYKGADYATESAVTGRELAPAEFPLHDHFSADVAIAQWRHWLLSGDRRHLEEKAYPILRETATYWQSRVVFNKEKDRYEVRQVMSPDETARVVDNDVYTNATARYNLLYAIEASQLLGKPYPREWKVIADKLWLPFDEKNRRYLEHEGYVRTKRKPKQADAELLFFPLGMAEKPEVVANTLTFYAEHASPLGPAMTSSVHAVIAANLAARLNDPSVTAPPDIRETDWLKKSVEYFRKSYKPFVREPFNDFSEKRTMNNTTFLTGAAGVLMGPLYGFGGINYDGEGIRAEPILPSNWKRLTITGIHYRGKVYDLTAEPGKPARLVPGGTASAGAVGAGMEASPSPGGN